MPSSWLDLAVFLCRAQPYGHLRLRNWLAARGRFDGATGPILVRGLRMYGDFGSEPDEQLLFLQRNRYADLWEVDWLVSQLHTGDTFVDAGANIGVHTLHCARRVGPGGRVIAIEPLPKNLTHLRKNIALNGFRQVSAGCLTLPVERDI